ncbi:MAG: 1-acyl-sn-glycerol-3-phosphate acyltransferase [Verrucomicrobiales bacterium]|nr:1-acyl-sn-glycerol-3-phosphate acyltransferase [Verrucomicrobiales bacterium]
MSYLIRLFFRLLLLPWFRLFYRVRRIGTQNVPSYGGVLLLPNHITYIDAFIYYLASPRPVRYVVVDKYVKYPAFGWFMKLFRAIPIDRNSPRDALTKSIDALKKGDAVCLFPEGGLTRTGLINDLKKGCEVIARRSDCPVVPVYTDGLWGSIFSFERGIYFKKWPNKFPCPTQVAFGEPIPPEEASTKRIFEGMLAASVDAFNARRCFEENLETAVIESLKTERRKNFSFEYAKNPRRWSRAEFLGMAISIARRWINNPPDDRQRIGILLPPGPFPGVINLGLFLAGKTPVSLPFNLRPDEVEKLALRMEELGIRTVITSKAFMPHLIDFWRGDEGRFIDIQTELTSPGRIILSQEKLFGITEPAWFTKWRLEINQRDKHREAIGLIESPDQEPVFLSSREIYRNAMQIMSADFVRKEDTILSEAPMNSIVGQMMQLWVPILNKGRTVCRAYSVREDSQLLRALAEGQNADLMVGDMNFYNDIDRIFDLPNLRFGMVFDDEADTKHIETREQEIKIPLAKCWSHAGRVVALGRPPENVQLPPHVQPQMTRKHGTAGRFLPGIAAKVEDDELFLRFSPTPPGQFDEWISAGKGHYIDEEGFVVLPEAL